MRKFKAPAILEEFRYTSFPSLVPVALFLASSVPVNYIFHEASVAEEVKIVWVYVSIITSIIGFVMVAAAKYICIHFFNNKIRVALFIAGAALFGGMKGVTSVLMVTAIVDGRQLDLAELLIRMYSGASVATGIAFALALRNVYKSSILQRKQEIDNQNQLMANDLLALRNEILLARTETEERLVQKILSNLDVRSDIDLYAEKPEKNWQKISEALHKGLVDRVRRQSHELAQISPIEFSLKERVRYVLRLKVLNLHPRVFALVQFSMGAAIYYSGWNPRNSAFLLALNTITSIVVTMFFRDFFLSKKDRSEKYNIAVFFGLILTVDLIYVINQRFVWGYIDPVLIFSVFIWHIFLIYSISGVSEILQQVQKGRELALSVNQDLRDKKRVLDQYLNRLNNEIGKHLHGYLLAKINTTASNLDLLAQQGNFDEYRIELEKLLSEFSLEGIRDGLRSDQIDDHFFDTLQELWDGLLEIEFVGDVEFYRDWQQVQTVELAHVVEEIISNAYRHGRATKICIEFAALDNGDLQIRGLDNGGGVSGKINQSLGSNIYELASEGRWSLKSRPEGGAVIELTITPYLWESAIRFTSGVPATFDQPASHTP